jgi:hypothetical protein
MPYLAMLNNEELELADYDAVASALKEGKIGPATWIADVNVEADWETVEEKFPDLCGQPREGA